MVSVLRRHRYKNAAGNISTVVFFGTQDVTSFTLILISLAWNMQLSSLLLGPRSFICLAMLRFGVCEWFGFHKVSASVPRDTENSASYFSRSKKLKLAKRLFSASKAGKGTESQNDFVPCMVESFLRMIVITATQLLPSKPRDSASTKATDSNVADHPAFWALRQEVVHKLSVKPQPFSALEDLVKISYGSKRQAPDGVLKHVLREVAEIKEGASAVQACKFELKREVINEYDPFFPHLSTKQHQKAEVRCQEIRRRHGMQSKAATTAPAMTQLEPFAGLTRKMLLEPFLLQVIMIVLHRTVTTIVHVTVSAEDEGFCIAPKDVVSDVALHATLSLLERGVNLLSNSAGARRTEQCESTWTMWHLLSAWSERFGNDIAREQEVQTECNNVAQLSVYNSLLCIGGYLHVDRIAALVGASSSVKRTPPQSMAPEVVAVTTCILDKLKILHPSFQKLFDRGQQPLQAVTSIATPTDGATQRREVIYVNQKFAISYHGLI